MSTLRSRFPHSSEVKDAILQVLSNEQQDLSLKEMVDHLSTIFAARLTPELLALTEATRSGSKWNHVIRSAKNQLVTAGYLRTRAEAGWDVFSLSEQVHGHSDSRIRVEGSEEDHYLNDSDYEEEAESIQTVLMHEEEPYPETQFLEGNRLAIIVNLAERNIAARLACIKAYGCLLSSVRI